MVTKPRHLKSGQAIIEFCIGLIAILAVFGGLIQLGRLGLIRMENRVEATRIATELSMADGDVTSTISYLYEVSDGPDTLSYSEDDLQRNGNADEAYDRLGARMQPGLVGAYDAGSPIAGMGGPGEMLDEMGFVRGTAWEMSIPILPVVRNLIYDADEVDLVSEVWMTQTGGIY